MSNEFLVDFIGIGAPRSGTAWISRCLAEHPDICFSKEKEVHFFDREYNYKRGIEYYASFFENCGTEKVKGEFTPTYYLDATIAEKIKSFFPNVKILVVLRNPIDRAFSDYVYEKRRKGYAGAFSDLLADTTSRTIRVGFYYRYLSAFLSHFDPRQVYILINEETRDRRKQSVQEIYSFLGVDNSFIPSVLNERPNASQKVTFRFPQLNRLFELRKKIKKNPFGYALVRFLQRLGINTLIIKVNKLNRAYGRKAEPAPELSPTERRRLFDIYRDDIAALEKYLDRNLDVWRKN